MPDSKAEHHPHSENGGGSPGRNGRTPRRPVVDRQPPPNPSTEKLRIAFVEAPAELGKQLGRRTSGADRDEIILRIAAWKEAIKAGEFPPYVAHRILDFSLAYLEAEGEPQASGASADDQERTKDVLRSAGLELPESAYHGPVGELVRLLEPHSEADPAALLFNALVALGNLVGSGPHIRIEGDKHPARLFAVLVGKTSKARKGTSWGRIRAVLEHVDRTWVKECVAGGLSSGEGLICHVRDVADGDDPLDRRLLAIEPEFASILRRMRREGNTLSTIVRQAWDNGDIRTLTRHNPLKATGAHVGIIGHITEDELRRYLTETEIANGFGNRFLWIPVTRSKLLPFGGDLRDEDLSSVIWRLRDAVSEARRIGTVSWDEEAAEAWVEVYEELSKGRPGMFGALTARGETQVTRLAVLYAVLDGERLIRTAHLVAAFGVWKYAEAGVARIFEDRTGDGLADNILERIRAQQDRTMTRNALSNALGRNYPADRMDQALEVLETAGLITIERGETGESGGRPPTIYVAR